MAVDGRAKLEAQENIEDTLLIGALLTIPMQALSRRVADAVSARGFSDFHQSNRPIFIWCKPGGSRLTELAKRAGVTKQSMGEMVDALERRGYVERVPDPTDARATLIRRTPRGWELTQLICKVVKDVQREWARALGRERFATLMGTLRELAVVLDEPNGTAGTAS